MHDGAGASGIHPLRHLASEDEKVLTESDRARVLHRTPVEVHYSDLVVLLEWIGETEDSLEVIESLLRHKEDVFRIKMLCERFPAVDPKWNFLLPAIDIMDIGVRTGDEGCDVSRDARRWIELPRRYLAIDRL